MDDYVRLPVTMPPLPSFPRAVVHEMRVRRHAPRSPSPEDAHAIFVKNVPCDSTVAHFRALVESLLGPGRLEDVHFKSVLRIGAASAAASAVAEDGVVDDVEHTSVREMMDPRRAQRIRQVAESVGATTTTTNRKRKAEQWEEEEGGEGERRRQAEDELDALQLPALWTRKVLVSGSSAVLVLVDEKSVAQLLKAVAKTNRTKKFPVWGEGVYSRQNNARPAATRTTDLATRRTTDPDAEEDASSDDDVDDLRMMDEEDRDAEEEEVETKKRKKKEVMTVPALGLPWLAYHLRQRRNVDRVRVQRSVHAFFEHFQRQEQAAQALAKRMRNEPDEDGFVTVTRGSSARHSANPVSANEARRARERQDERDRKRQANFVGFYRFQLRDKRKERQVALLKQFESDQLRVRAMKEKRNQFQPET